MTYPGGQAFTYNYASGMDSNLNRVTAIRSSTTTLATYTYLGLGMFVSLLEWCAALTIVQVVFFSLPEQMMPVSVNLHVQKCGLAYTYRTLPTAFLLI
jgi:hypothetical protein